MTTKICMLLALCFLPIFSSLSHCSRVPTTAEVSTTDYYDNPPWVPPEWFYGYFPPQVADMIRQQVGAMTEWMRQYQSPYGGGGSYPQPQQPQPQPQPQPQKPPPVQQQPDYPPAAGECSSETTQVIDTCAQQKRAAKSVNGYSWSCSYNENCCKAAVSVSDECVYLSPMLRTIKNVCCPGQ